MTSRKIQVFGRVQGVYFRVYTKKKADDLGLCGWVRNEPDGSVVVEVQGDRSDVDDFVKWCHKGPPMARVDRVVVKNKETTEYEGFLIFS